MSSSAAQSASARTEPLRAPRSRSATSPKQSPGPELEERDLAAAERLHRERSARLEHERRPAGIALAEEGRTRGHLHRPRPLEEEAERLPRHAAEDRHALEEGEGIGRGGRFHDARSLVRGRAEGPVDTRWATGYPSLLVGPWRSLVAHLNGVQGVASSNLAGPTSRIRHLRRRRTASSRPPAGRRLLGGARGEAMSGLDPEARGYEEIATGGVPVRAWTRGVPFEDEARASSRTSRGCRSCTRTSRRCPTCTSASARRWAR